MTDIKQQDSNTAAQTIIDQIRDQYMDYISDWVKEQQPTSTDMEQSVNLMNVLVNNSNNLNYLKKMIEFGQSGSVSSAINRTFAHAFMNYSLSKLKQYLCLLISLNTWKNLRSLEKIY